MESGGVPAEAAAGARRMRLLEWRLPRAAALLCLRLSPVPTLSPPAPPHHHTPSVWCALLLLPVCVMCTCVPPVCLWCVCRYVVQEIIKEMAKSRPIGADGQRGFKVLQHTQPQPQQLLHAAPARWRADPLANCPPQRAAWPCSSDAVTNCAPCHPYFLSFPLLFSSLPRPAGAGAK